MIGAIIGDITGSIYEYGYKAKRNEFALWQEGMKFTDDTVATIAVMKALLIKADSSLEELKKEVVEQFKYHVRKYPFAGWGGYFMDWALGRINDDYAPYNSFGNGAAMRISPVGWYAKTEEEVKALSKAITEVTHNHKEGLKGAECVAMCIYWALHGYTQKEILKMVEKNYYPHVDFFDDQDLVQNYKFDVTCEGTVPVAVFAFCHSSSFEDCLRRCVSYGGDTDTLSAISCSIAEAFYRTDRQCDWRNKVYERLPKDFIETIERFEALSNKRI